MLHTSSLASINISWYEKPNVPFVEDHSILLVSCTNSYPLCTAKITASSPHRYLPTCTAWSRVTETSGINLQYTYCMASWTGLRTHHLSPLYLICPSEAMHMAPQQLQTSPELQHNIREVSDLITMYIFMTFSVTQIFERKNIAHMRKEEVKVQVVSLLSKSIATGGYFRVVRTHLILFTRLWVVLIHAVV